MKWLRPAAAGIIIAGTASGAFNGLLQGHANHPATPAVSDTTTERQWFSRDTRQPAPPVPSDLLDSLADIGGHNARLDSSDPWKYCRETATYDFQQGLDIDPDAPCQVGDDGRDYADHALQADLHRQYMAQHPEFARDDELERS